MKEGAEESTIYIADSQPYYNYFTHEIYSGKAGRSITLPTPLSAFPVLMQGGSILPIRERVRRSSPLMWQDPFTLVIAVDNKRSARGELYLDDGEGYGYTSGEYVHRHFSFEKGRLSSSMIGGAEISNNAYAQSIGHVRIERIVVLGLKKVKKVTVAGQPVGYRYDGELVIKNPGLAVVEDWELLIE